MEDPVLACQHLIENAFYLAGKTLQGQELINMQDLQASVAEEQSVFMAAAHQLGSISYRKELTTCRPEIQMILEVCQAARAS